MKKCSKCGEVKEYSEFYFSGGIKPHFVSQCKDCVKITRRNNTPTDLEKYKERACEYAKKYRANNYEKVISRERKWKAENREKVRKSTNAWNMANAERHKELITSWQKNNKKSCNERNKKWKEDNPEKFRKSKIKYNLKTKLGETPPPELVEVKLLIIQTKRLCKTLKN